ncbi:MAG TPA: hypothetical protein VHM90_21525, partial [Phycisphaerae bacterium]|nr:hypothetical protein [Phycisphaerae bacterium]
MELREALTQIAEIRQQMARGELFRGYRAATTAFSGIVALVTGIVQMSLLPLQAPGWDSHAVTLWVAAAALCVAVVGAEMIFRTLRSSSKVQRSLTLLAVEQFVPSVAAGALLTWILLDFLPGQIALLPGLWMMLFSLGVFASCRLLPRWVFVVAGFYLLAGVLTLILASRGQVRLLNL